MAVKSDSVVHRWIENLDEFRAIAEQWDEALVASGNHNPFLLADFIVSWCQYFTDASTLRILVVVDATNRIVGGLPLYLRTGYLRDAFCRVLYHVGGAAANYTEPFSAIADLPILAVLLNALSKRTDWDAMQLTDVRAASPLIAEHQDSASDLPFAVSVVQDHANLAIDLTGGADRYMAGIPSKLKRDLRSKRRLATKDYGCVELREIKGCVEVERCFDVYADFSRRAFEARKRRSSFADARQVSFYREFLRRMERQHRLDTHVLSVGETILAVSFAYRFGDGFNWALTAYNHDYRRVRPGYLLIEALVQEMSRRGETSYNWFGHERFYKLQWCNAVTPLYRVVAVRRTWRGVVYRISSWAQQEWRANRLGMDDTRTPTAPGR